MEIQDSQNRRLAIECEPFIDGFERLDENYSLSAFHDSVLSQLTYQLSDDGLASDVLLSFSIDGEVETILKFVRVHGIEINVPDIRISFFYSIKFYVARWCDYGDCIVMETDGDWVKIVAEKIVVIE